MAGVPPPETARNQGNVDSGWPCPPVALGWRRAACSHILPCTLWVLSALRSHQAHHFFHLLALWVFDLSYFYQKKCKCRKPLSAGSFCHRKIDLVGFLPCNSTSCDTSHHTSHLLLAIRVGLCTEVLQCWAWWGKCCTCVCCSVTYHVLLDRCLSSIKLPLKWGPFCSGCDQRLLVGFLR